MPTGTPCPPPAARPLAARRPGPVRFAAATLLLTALACAPADAPDDAGTPDASARPVPAPFTPSPDEEAEIVAALQTVFDALESGDGALLRSVLDPEILMTWAESRDGETALARSDLEGLVARIEGSEARLVERMWDPVVRVDGALATIWAPYDFYVGSELSHCGVDAATLLDGPDGWRIVGLSWTRQQPPACALHPEGPPPAPTPAME